MVPAPTLYALADGVCRQFDAGTPEPVIVENIRAVAAYGANLSGGALSADAAARLLLDAARSNFC